MSLITIDQLLESVDLDFEPRWVTKDKDGGITLFKTKPDIGRGMWVFGKSEVYQILGKLKLSEFANKHWTECIYEVPRKTTGKIEKLERHIEMNNSNAWSCPPSGEEFMYKINELVDAVNELKGAKNE